MSGEVMSATVHRAWAADLDTRSLYELLRLRVDVFVVEQASPYSELDGRDLEEGTRHYWLAGDGLGRAGARLPAPAAGARRRVPHRPGVHGPLGARAADWDGS